MESNDMEFVVGVVSQYRSKDTKISLALWKKWNNCQIIDINGIQTTINYPNI
jgi:hypothetical protein